MKFRCCFDAQRRASGRYRPDASTVKPSAPVAPCRTRVAAATAPARRVPGWPSAYVNLQVLLQLKLGQAAAARSRNSSSKATICHQDKALRRPAGISIMAARC